jgi:hypothetical protein
MIYQNKALDTPGHFGWPQSTEAKFEESMSTDNYLAVDESSSQPVERASKFTSRWAIPRVEPLEQPKRSRKRRQINNIVLLFIIYVFKQAKNSMVSRRLRVKYRSMAAQRVSKRKRKS